MLFVKTGIRINKTQGGDVIQVSGWREGMKGIRFVLVVREYTEMTLAEAKACLDRMLDGEVIEMQPCKLGESKEFAEKLRKYGVVADVITG